MGLFTNILTSTNKAVAASTTNGATFSTVIYNFDGENISLADARFATDRDAWRFIDREIQANRDVKLIVNVPTGDTITSIYFYINANIAGDGGAYEFKQIIDGSEYLITIGEARTWIEIG